MKLKRIFRHLLTPHWSIGLAFPKRALAAIERAVAVSEKIHDGELRFAVEAGLHLPALLHGQTARQRAAELFSLLRVWDTEHNCGVLIYVQLVDRKVEILADRGINALVPREEWNAVCRGMEQAFRRGQFEGGAVAAIGEIGALLGRHFPPRAGRPNELPDKPVVL